MTPEQKVAVAQCTIKGMTSREIAPIVGVSHTTVSRNQQKPDIRAIVEQGLSQLARRGLKPAVNTLCRAAALGNTKDIVKTPDLLKISVQASDKILSHISGSGPQTVINQLIYQQSARAGADESSVAMLMSGLSAGKPVDAIDVIPE